MNMELIEEYLKKPYTIEVIRDTNEENPGWVARVVELPGCYTQSDTFDELEEMIEDAMRGWLEVALEDGLPIPEPRAYQEYSGKFIVRLTKSLHQQLVEQAGREGISLNQYVSTELAKVVGLSVASNSPKYQISHQDIRDWIKEAIHQSLKEMGIAIQDRKAFEAYPVSPQKTTDELFKGFVLERIDSDYRTWLQDAGRDTVTPKPESSILDNLLE